MDGQPGAARLADTFMIPAEHAQSRSFQIWCTGKGTEQTESAETIFILPGGSTTKSWISREAIILNMAEESGCLLMGLRPEWSPCGNMSRMNLAIRELTGDMGQD